MTVAVTSTQDQDKKTAIQTTNLITPKVTDLDQSITKQGVG